MPGGRPALDIDPARISRQEALRARQKQERHDLNQASKKAYIDQLIEEHLNGPPIPLVDWIEKYLKIPPGHPNAGQPFILMDWQIAFVEDAFKDDCFEALLCIARKNAKSATIAAVVLAHLAGPPNLRKEGWRCGVLSINSEKAEELTRQIEDIARASNLYDEKELPDFPNGRPWGVKRQKSKKLVESATGMVEIQAASKAAGHASGFDLAIVDEIGLLEERFRPLVSGMITSTSAKNGRFLALSVHGDGPFIPEILDRSKDEESPDPSLVVHHYMAPVGCDLTDKEAWRAANPGLGEIKSEEYMTRAARRVIATPVEIANFRAFDLNQPLNPEDVYLVEYTDWKACMESPVGEREGPLYVGLDFGEVLSMTSAVCYWPETGRFEGFAAFPSVPPINDRAKADRAGLVYHRAVETGELWLFPGRRVLIDEFLKKVGEAIEHYPITMTGCDRYRQNEFLQVLDNWSNPDWGLGEPNWRGTGAHSKAQGSHDVRAFQQYVVDKKIRPGNSGLLFPFSMRNTTLRFDAGGNPALNKKKQNNRIDLVQAAVIAVGMSKEYESFSSELTFLGEA